MDKAEFVKDFIEFNSEVKNMDIEIATREVAMLYAVYRKDLRVNHYKNGFEQIDSQMATEKQKNYLLNLAKAKNAKLTRDDVNKMTRQQASKAIDALLEGI